LVSGQRSLPFYGYFIGDAGLQHYSEYSQIDNNEWQSQVLQIKSFAAGFDEYSFNLDLLHLGFAKINICYHDP
tara:strand:+ start:5032 stop:5250 length:219 start_codon:yes stop_codon:yes gene_type:complete